MNARIYSTILGMYYPHIFYIDWHLYGFRETNKKVFWWMNFAITSVIINVILGFIYADFTGFILFIGLFFGVIAMVYVATPYNGMTKHMGLPHAFAVGIPVIYDIIRLLTNLNCNSSFFCQQITFDNNPVLFVYLIIIIILFSYCTFQDIYDSYVWYIRGNHVVFRSQKTLNKLKEKGLLYDGIEGKQIIKIGHKLNGNIDEFGYVKRESMEAPLNA